MFYIALKTFIIITIFAFSNISVEQEKNGALKHEDWLKQWAFNGVLGMNT